MEAIMASKKKPAKEITILGYVSEIESENDDFVGVKISTDDDDYYVTQNKISKLLESLIDEDVEVTGIVSSDGEDGIKYITVTDYEVLNLDYGYEDDEEKEEDDFFSEDYFRD
jgi:hypothetical protein